MSDAATVTVMEGRDEALADLGVALMQNVVTALSAAKNSSEGRAVVLNEMVSREAEVQLGFALALHPDEMANLMRQVASTAPTARVAGAVASALEAARNVAAQSETTSQVRGRRLVDHLGTRTPPSGTDLVVPSVYRIDPWGVYRTESEGNYSRVTEVPIFVSRMVHDASSGQTHLELQWLASPQSNTWVTRVVPRQAIHNANKILDLSSYVGIPISSDNARAISRYLCDFEATNARRLVRVESANHLGWQDDSSFLYPDEHVVPPGKRTMPRVPVLPSGMHSVAEATKTHGTLEGWVEEVGVPTMRYPVASALLYTAMASPLIRVIGGRNFIVDVSGYTSIGKTTALMAAVSAFGCPDDRSDTLLMSWDVRKAPFETIAAGLGGLPYALDDTKRLGAQGRDYVARLIFDFAAGQSGARGTQAGGMRTQTNWSGAALSTGEVPLTSYSSDGGSRARVLCLTGLPYGPVAESTGDIVDGIAEGAKEHYGHVGRIFARYLVGNQADWPKLRKAHRAHFEKLCDQAGRPSGVARRLVAYVATISLAADILHVLLGDALPRPEHDPFACLLDAVKLSVGSADRSLAALADTVGWAASNQQHFDGRSQDRTAETFGAWKRTSWEVLYILPHILRAQLARMSHDYAEVVPRWAERGWLVTANGACLTEARVDGEPSACVGIRRAAVEYAVAHMTGKSQ